MDLTIDIETIESQDERVREHVRAKVKALDDFDAMVEAERVALDKTALNAAFGEIASIAVAIDDREPKTWSRSLRESERELLLDFRSDIVKALDVAARQKDGPVLVGHNVVDFDRPFIRQRGLVHGIKMPWIFTREVKPWETMGLGDHDFVRDTMRMWLGTHRGAISLDDLCAALGLPGKGDTTGADVGRLMREGKHKQVAIYNADDVRKTRAVDRRLREAT